MGSDEMMLHRMRNPYLQNRLLQLLAALLLYSALFPALALQAYAQRDSELDGVLGESITICTDQGMVQMGLDEYRARLQLDHSLAWTDAIHAWTQPLLPSAQPELFIAPLTPLAPVRAQPRVPHSHTHASPLLARAPPTYI